MMSSPVHFFLDTHLNFNTIALSTARGLNSQITSYEWNPGTSGTLTILPLQLYHDLHLKFMFMLSAPLYQRILKWPGTIPSWEN